jgi:hypothetical protein
MVESSEFHGIFQFQADFFETNERQRHFIDKEYELVETVNGWFLDALNNVDEIFRQSMGPNQIKHIIEYRYSHAEYSEALRVCDLWLDANSRLAKPFRVFEVLEIAIRCCLRLNVHNKALEYADRMPPTSEAGVMFTIALVFRLNGRYIGIDAN